MHTCHLPESIIHPTLEIYKTTDCIFTFDYIQTEYINMELKQSNINKFQGPMIICIGPKVDGG